MINVQLENGYTRISNELLEELAKLNLNGTQARIVYTIFRQTYGYQRKEHDISITFLSKATNINKMQIQRELAALIQGKIINIIVDATFSESRVLAFNKNYIEWKLINRGLANTLTGNQKAKSTVSQLDSTTVSQLANQIKKKENIKEKSIEEFFQGIWKLLPKKMGKGQVSLKQKKCLFEKVGEERLIKAIEKFNNEMKDKETQFIPYGSTFLNSVYEDYLEEVKTVGADEDKKYKKMEIIERTQADIDKLVDEKNQEAIRRSEEAWLKIKS